MIRNYQLPCGHLKHVKIRHPQGWRPWCHECLRKAGPIAVHPIREQQTAERLGLTEER